MELTTLEERQPNLIPTIIPEPGTPDAAQQLSATGKSLKLRASDRQTPSQETALSKLKEKSTKLSANTSHPRKVVNYSRQENFT